MLIWVTLKYKCIINIILKRFTYTHLMDGDVSDYNDYL